MSEIRSNLIIAILTPTPRRITSYAGRTADGRLGLIVAAQYYKAAIVDVPGIDEADSAAPLQIAIELGNAKNEYTDLYANASNFGKPITITRLEFTGLFHESFAPTFTSAVWFEGITGRPSLRGERLILECYADMGRRGTCPKTKSRTLMLSHQPLAAGKKLPITVRT